MGGSIALHLARSYPPEKLILLAPLWKMLGGDWKVNLLPVVKQFVKRMKPFARADFDEPGVREFFAGAMPDLDLDNPDVRNAIREQVEISTATLDELRRLTSSVGSLSQDTRVQTLVIQGLRDDSVRSEDTRKLVAKMGATARLEELDTDHMLVNPERPAWKDVERLVVEFSQDGAL